MSNQNSSAPAITDHLPIALRAYASPPVIEKAYTLNKKPRPKFRHVPASGWTIVFDTETTSDAAQSLRFGTYQVRQKGELHEAGIFYEPDGVSTEELAVLRDHALANHIKLITRDEFAGRIFYGIGYELRAAIIGFNLPFDISRIAINHDSARTNMRGGFTFKIDNDKRLPNVQVKHISRRCAFIRFAAPMRQRNNRSDRKRGNKNPVRRGHFIDINTLAGAILAQSFSLATLSEFLGISNPKLKFDDFAAPISDEMAGYAVRDVQATWECYAKLIERHAQLGIPNTPPEKIYSEASIGKGYLKAMGITPWRKSQPDFPQQILANIMGGYFGGRSEIRIRRELRQVMLCDFLSMYPTVCTLMGLWNFVIADGMTWRDSTAETQEWLANINTEMLKSQAIWRELTTLVRVKSEADIFPVRARYGGATQTTIGTNYLTADRPLWFTLADCVASKLLTGKTPQILEAMTFKPRDVPSDLKTVLISGKSDYAVNPIRDDFYKRVIELRQETKALRDKASGTEFAKLDTDQNALKIAANATSYGVFVEVNVVDHASDDDITVYSSTSNPYTVRTCKIEETGAFFHPLLATLITGAARLMLAVTEHLVKEAGLDWAFCDTDSMAIAKPETMDNDIFYSRAERIVNWFADLNPYDFDGSILKIEDVNYDLAGSKAKVPLFCWAVSAKRYALFNLDKDGSPILRKASAHGLGHLMEPYDHRNPASGIPVPKVPVSKIGVGFKPWQHDLWWQIISAALAGKPDQVDLSYHPALENPAISRYGATTPELLRWFKTYNLNRQYANQVKPFGFLLSLAASEIDTTERIIDGKQVGRRRKTKPIKPIAPYTRNPAQAASSAFDRETRRPVAQNRLKTFRQALAGYHLQSESKFLNGNFFDRGPTERRHIQEKGINNIGKEANALEEQMVLGIDDEANPDYGISPDQTLTFVDELRDLADVLGRKLVADALGVSMTKLPEMLAGKPQNFSWLDYRSLPIIVRLREKANLCKENELKRLNTIKTSVERIGLRATARMLDCDASNLRRLLKNT